jgi:hypothetical protein
MITDERIHIYCRDIVIQSNDNGLHLQNAKKLIDRQSFHDVTGRLNGYYFIQKQLNDEIKDSSIKFSAFYWENISESIKLISKCWNKIFNISNPNSPVPRCVKSNSIQ